MYQLIEFFSNHIILFTAFIILLFMILSLEFNNITKKYKSLSYQELTKMINQSKITLIDLRGNDEFVKGHIVDSMNVALDKINQSKIDKKKPIITYSTSEADAINAAKEFVRKGFNDVYYLEGGLQSWVENNMPLVSENKK
mgnify:CR=1 FL=1